MDLADLLGDNSSSSYKEKKSAGKKSDFINVLQKSRSVVVENKSYTGSVGQAINTNNTNISGEEVNKDFLN